MPSKTITDLLGGESEQAMWEFCGKFPLDEIAKDRRACREGWRSRGNLEDDFDMLAAVRREDSCGPWVGLERETTDGFVGGEGRITIEDMQAEDWYLEVPKLQGAVSSSDWVPPVGQDC